MNILGKYIYAYRHRKNTASIAKERLQIIIAHERGQRIGTTNLQALQQELMPIIARHFNFNIDPEQIKVALEREGDTTVLELNIPIPEEEDYSSRFDG